MKRSAGLYLHVPFCSHRCPYCDFNVWPVDHLEAAGRFDRRGFVEILRRETAWLLSRHEKQSGASPLETIYLGGGTPSLLEPGEARDLIRQTGRPAAGPSEVTLEANPESLSEEALAGFIEAGVTRLSLGVQSFSDEVLQKLGREHDGAASRRVLSFLSKSRGLGSWTCDLLYGVAGQSEKTFARDVDELLDFGPPHVSLYALEVHEQTAFGLRERRGEALAASDDEQAGLFDLARERLLSAGYRHYELSSFCRPGHEGKHNSLYWRRANVLAAGPGGVGFLEDTAAPWGIRWKTPRSIPAYGTWVRSLETSEESTLSTALRASSPGSPEIEILEKRSALDESLFLGLRLLEEGVDLVVLSQRFGQEAVERRLAGAQHHFKSGALQRRGERLHLNPDWAFVANAVLADVLEGETAARKSP